jgi:hypothetical protein
MKALLIAIKFFCGRKTAINVSDIFFSLHEAKIPTRETILKAVTVENGRRRTVQYRR